MTDLHLTGVQYEVCILGIISKKWILTRISTDIRQYPLRRLPSNASPVKSFSQQNR